MTTLEALNQLLATTSLPPDLTAGLSREALDLWLLSEPDLNLLASDLALCHPTPAPGETRVRAVDIDRVGTWRFTVVHRDRAGLLADTTGVLAASGIGVTTASALTFGPEPLAVHSLTASAPRLDAEGWESLGPRIRTAAGGGAIRPRFEPVGATEVSATGQPGGRMLLTVSAPDQLGLLCAVCGLLADQQVSIEVAMVGGTDGRAEDVFLVQGDVNAALLASGLSAAGRSGLAQAAAEAVGRTPVIGGLLRRGLEAII